MNHKAKPWAEAAPEGRARRIAEQAAGLLQAGRLALPQAALGAAGHVQRVQEWPAAFWRRAPPCRSTRAASISERITGSANHIRPTSLLLLDAWLRSCPGARRSPACCRCTRPARVGE